MKMSLKRQGNDRCLLVIKKKDRQKQFNFQCDHSSEMYKEEWFCFLSQVSSLTFPENSWIVLRLFIILSYWYQSIVELKVAQGVLPFFLLEVWKKLEFIIYKYHKYVTLTHFKQ